MHIDDVPPELHHEPAPAEVSVERSWWSGASLPLVTVGIFLALALLLWLNAVLNRYRFNVAIAVLGSVPMLVLLIRGAFKAREARHSVPAR